MPLNELAARVTALEKALSVADASSQLHQEEELARLTAENLRLKDSETHLAAAAEAEREAADLLRQVVGAQQEVHRLQSLADAAAARAGREYAAALRTYRVPDYPGDL